VTCELSKGDGSDSLAINSFEEYRQMPGMNWSTLKWARKCIHSMRRVQKASQSSTSEMQFGQDVHSALLEPGDFQSCVTPAPAGLRRGTNEWKRLTAEADENGYRLMKYDDYVSIMDIISSVNQNSDARRLVYELEGISEASVQWTDSGSSLLLKARIDRFIPVYGDDGHTLIVDVKTTQDVGGLSKRLVQWPYMYLHQMAYYRRAVRAFTDRQDVDVAILAVEKGPGHPTAVFHLDSSDMDIADREIDALLYTVAEAELIGSSTEQYESTTLRPPQWWTDKQQGATE
jgi:hypothetical protein